MSGNDLILSTGRIYCDLIFAGLDAPVSMGREVFADELKLCTGGGAFITAAYLSALGERTGLVGSLPAAPFCTPVEQEIDDHGVEAHCQRAEGHDFQLTAAIVGQTDRAFVTRRVGVAVPQSLIDALPPARHLHIGELSTALEHPDLLDKAQRAGMSLSLDCGWDEAALANPDAAAVIAKVDVFLPNESEAGALAANQIAVTPRGATIVKQGEAGAMCCLPDGQTIHAPGLRAKVLDTTGAGDAFNAGFLSAWLAGYPLQAALGLGNVCGAAAVARLGGASGLADMSQLRRDSLEGQQIVQAAQ